VTAQSVLASGQAVRPANAMPQLHSPFAHSHCTTWFAQPSKMAILHTGSSLHAPLGIAGMK
jgi:hypothetical protein